MMGDENPSIVDMIFFGVDDEITYNWFHDGRGTESTTDAVAQEWRKSRDLYEDVLALVKRGLAESQASWEGVSADAAHGAVSPMQAWVQQATDSAAKAAATVEAQSSFFSETKARLEPPVQVPDKPWWNDFWPGDTNYDQALAAKQANSARNLDLVWSYGDSTQSNTAGYPAFDEPVVVTTDVASAPDRPGRPPQPGIVEWPTAARPKPAPAGGPEPGGPGAEPRDSAVAGPPPADPRPETQTGGSTVSSGHAGIPVANSPLPQGQSQPGGRLPVGSANPTPGVVSLRGPGVPDGSGRIPATRTGEPGPDARPGGRGLAGPDGRPGAGGRVGAAVPEGGAASGRGGAAGVRGAAGNVGGLVPGGATAPRGEDKEHTNKFGPVDHHEEFWEDLPMVAPQVIGMDDDEQ